MNRGCIFFTFIICSFLVACSHYDELQKHSKESKAEGNESHNTGQDCMSCHNNSSSDAADEGWWNIAGSVYSNNTPANNVTVELWSEPQGKGYKILSLTSDKKGNFYTNKIINFKGGCYTKVISGSKVKYMSAKFVGGTSCSGASCHGGTQSVIDIN